jgi:IS5 family transposase
MHRGRITDIRVLSAASNLPHHIAERQRDTLYGHKLCLTGGASNLITDCVIGDGNPADTTLTDQMLDPQRELYARYPLDLILDSAAKST